MIISIIIIVNIIIIKNYNYLKLEKLILLEYLNAHQENLAHKLLIHFSSLYNEDLIYFRNVH